MATFVNSSPEHRVWSTIQRPDGRTLELGPGESAELDVTADFAASNLERVAAKRTKVAPEAVEADEPES